MIRTTPFHERTSALNETGPVGALVGLPGRRRATRCRTSSSTSRSATRRAVRHVAAVQVPDPRPGRGAVPRRRPRPRHPDLPAGPRASTPLWCDDRGFVVEDGVILRHGARRVPADRAPSRTSPTSRTSSAGSTSRSRTSATTWAVLAVQGPRSRDLLARARAARSPSLPYFGLATTQDRQASRSTISRTGYTGDLGYEVWVPADDALDRLGRDLGRRAAATASCRSA